MKGDKKLRTNRVNQELTYHYTSVYALSQILNTGNLWFSDCRFLNDTQEFKNTTKIFLDNFTQSERKPLEQIFLFHSVRFNPFIFCCSKSPEVLSQWKSYADDGKGVALGFVKDFLETPGQTQFVECIYDRHSEFLKSLKLNFKDELAEILEKYNSKDVEKDVIGIPLCIDEQVSKIFSELLRVKNEAFKEEQEIRLIYNSKNEKEKIFSRARNHMLIPYVEYNLYNKTVIDREEVLWVLLNEIWLGPKADLRIMDALRAIYKSSFWIPNENVKHYNCGYI